MLTAAEFARLAYLTGVPVTFTQAKPPQAVILVPKAIISSLTKASEAVINSFGVGGFSVQVHASLFAVPPEKFDQVVDGNGHRYVVEHVVTHTERGSGIPTSYTLYSKGRA